MNKQDTGYIYAQYRDKVFGFVRSKVFRSEDVEDLVQEVFLKVYANLDRYDEVKASLSTWIYTITRNTVYDYLKAKRDRPVFELLDNTEDATDEAPDEELLRNETLAALWKNCRKNSGISLFFCTTKTSKENMLPRCLA